MWGHRQLSAAAASHNVISQPQRVMSLNFTTLIHLTTTICDGAVYLDECVKIEDATTSTEQSSKITISTGLVLENHCARASPASNATRKCSNPSRRAFVRPNCPPRERERFALFCSWVDTMVPTNGCGYDCERDRAASRLVLATRTSPPCHNHRRNYRHRILVNEELSWKHHRIRNSA